MSEYIITDKQFKTATEAYLEHELSLPITNVFISGDKLPEIVRCSDCDYYDHWDACGRYREKHVCGHWDYLEIEPDGFCAWGERKERIEQ